MKREDKAKKKKRIAEEYGWLDKFVIKYCYKVTITYILIF